MDPENDEESPSVDLEVEERLADWLEVNRVENGSPVATLYKFTGETGEAREQVDYYRGIFPSRHEVGLEYGPGRFILIIRNTTAQKGAKSTSCRFRLHESYLEKSLKFKRDKADRERPVLGPPNALPPALPAPQNGKESLLEAFTIVRSMQADTLAMFKPILERILSPAAVPALPAPKSPFEDYALSRQIMKDSLKESMNMMAMMQKAMVDARSGTDPDPDDEEKLPDEKQSMFERIIALAEPFINILAQNNLAAKMAAAGIKAAPQFREVIKDANLARRIITYVEQKEGPERASVALKNLGLAREDYLRPAADARPRTPSSPGHTVPARRTAAGGGGVKDPGKPGDGKKLDPKMEVKP